MKRSLFNKIVMFLVFTMVLSLVVPAFAEVKDVTVGVSLFAFNRPWFQQVVQGLKESAKKYEGEFNFTLHFFDPQGDVGKQIQGVENFITQNVDALILQPISPTSLAAPLAMADEKNIPVFLLDTTVQDSEYVSWIGSNSIDIGKLGGQLLVEELTKRKGSPKGNVILLDSLEMSTLRDRSQGFRDYLAEYPEIKIVARGDMKNDTSVAFSLMENFLTANPEVDAVFGPNDTSTSGALNAILAAGRENIFIIGADTQIDCLESIINGGPVLALIAQQPTIMGSVSIDNVVKYLKGESIPKTVYSDLLVVNSENVQQIIEEENRLNQEIQKGN